MSETPAPRRILHLVVGHPSANEIRELSGLVDSECTTEIFQLNETNAREALEKIFAADTVAVWGELAQGK